MSLMKQSSERIFDHPRFSLEDFSSRWTRARISALRSTLDSTASGGSGNDESLSEELLLQRVSPEKRDSVLRSVFDSSRRFGMNASRHFGMSFEISDLAEILQSLSIPCFAGKWRSHNSAFVLERNGCRLLTGLGSVACDYWREALDGLVVGVGENERLARHRSRGHKDTECVDVLFVEEYVSPRVLDPAASPALIQQSRKYGPVPADVISALDPARQRFRNMKVQLVLEGESEGILYYRLDADEGVLCGAGGKLLHDSFSREAALVCPNLSVRDASPLAVYGGST